ncbi:MAG: hypothetical protein WBZ36_10860 [Candidatus Nitrosopolaris sp.]
MVSAQKALASNFVSNLNFPIVDEFVKKSNEMNRLTINAINAAAENFKTLNRTIGSVNEFNSAATAWLHLFFNRRT